MMEKMKFCVHCGKEIKASAEFCPYCGSKQPLLETKENVTAKQPLNEHLFVHNYFTFLNKNVKNPKLGNQEGNLHYGLISYGLFVLLNSLAISHLIAKIANNMMSTNVLFTGFFESFFLLAVVLFINVLTLYVLTAQVYRTPLSLKNTFELIYAPASLAVYLSFATLFFAFLVESAPILFASCLSISFLLISYAFIGNLWSAEKRAAGVNRFYATVIALVANAIVIGIVIRLFVDVWFTQAGYNIFQDFLDSFPW